MSCGRVVGFGWGVQSCLPWLPPLLSILGQLFQPLGELTKHAGVKPRVLQRVLWSKMFDLPSEKGQCSEVSGGWDLPLLLLLEPFGQSPSRAGGGLGCFWLQGPGRLIRK